MPIDAAPDSADGFDMPVAVIFRSLTASRFILMGKMAFDILGLRLVWHFLPPDHRSCPYNMIPMVNHNRWPIAILPLRLDPLKIYGSPGHHDDLPTDSNLGPRKAKQPSGAASSYWRL